MHRAPGIPVTGPGERAPREGAFDRLAGCSGLSSARVLRGCGSARREEPCGPQSYLLGEVRDTGWWYFFPVALGVETPLGVHPARRGRGDMPHSGHPGGLERRRRLEPLAIAIAILVVCLPSRINIGLRHLLPLLSLPFDRLPERGLVGPDALSTTFPWGVSPQPCCCSGTWPCPSRRIRTTSPYFNELAGEHPERILVDSDLDSGQDLKRLADTLQGAPDSQRVARLRGIGDRDPARSAARPLAGATPAGEGMDCR